MPPKWTRSERLLLIQWMFVTALGVSLLRLIVFGNIRVLITGTLALALLASCQWAVALRGRVQRAEWWIPLTVVGWATAYYLLPTAGQIAQNLGLFGIFGMVQAFITVDGLVVGLCLGVAQWLIVRTWVSRALLWIPINVLAFALGFFASAVIETLAYQATNVNVSDLLGYAAAITAGLVAGALTALAIVSLLKSRQ